MVELAVVICIIAIILAYAVPSYKSVISQNRMASEINDLNNDVELARSSAIKLGMPVVICPSTSPTAATPSCNNSSSWETGWIVFSDIANNQTYATASGDTLLRVHAPLTQGDTLTGSTGTASTGPFSGTLTLLEFNRMGGTTIAGASAVNYAALSLHDSKNTLAWRRCLITSSVGTATAQSQAQNPGVCP